MSGAQPTRATQQAAQLAAMTDRLDAVLAQLEKFEAVARIEEMVELAELVAERAPNLGADVYVALDPRALLAANRLAVTMGGAVALLELPVDDTEDPADPVTLAPLLDAFVEGSGVKPQRPQELVDSGVLHGAKVTILGIGNLDARPHVREAVALATAHAGAVTTAAAARDDDNPLSELRLLVC